MSKRYRKLISFFLVVSMLFLSFGFSFAQSTDYQNHWASEKIYEWIEKGLIKGYSNNTFKPDKSITRAEFAAVVNRIFGFEATVKTDFSDVLNNAWYKADIEKAKAAGYLSGYEDNTVRPENPITREEAACILEKIMMLNAPEGFANLITFADAEEISDWSKAAVSAALEKEIISGYPDKTFKPANKITRAETVEMLDRALTAANSINKYKVAGVYGPTAGTETIDGDAVIAAAGTTLQNVVVTGDLSIAETVGDGDVILKNVNVKGKVYVNGGGSNSIHFDNCIFMTVILNKDSVRVVAEGTTTVQEIRLISGAVLSEEVVSGTGFNNVTISQFASAGINLSLSGTFNNVKINGDKVNLRVLSGTVTKMEVAMGADGTAINLANGVTVQKLNIDSAVNVSGTGKIDTVVTSATGSVFETNPTTIQQTDSSRSETTGSGSGSGGGNGDAPLSFVGAHLTTISGSTSTEGESVEDSDDVPADPTIRLEFDRGVVREYWSNNKSCIALKSASGAVVSSNVFRIADTDSEKRYIFLKPYNNLTEGAAYEIIISSGLKANNGNTLGSQITINFTVEDNSSGGGGSSERDDLAVALQTAGTKIAGNTFNLSISGAADSNNDYLTGSYNVTVTSNLNGEVYNASTTFSDGDAIVTIPAETVTKAGIHTLTLAIAGVTEQPTVNVTVVGMTSMNAANCTVTTDYNLAKGISRTVTVALKDKYGNPVSDTPKTIKIIATIIGNNVTTAEHYTITGNGISTETYSYTTTFAISAPIDSDGEYQFYVGVPSIVDPGDGISIQVTQNNGTFIGSSFSYVEPSPTVTAVLSGTITSAAETDIVAGGKKVVLTLTNGSFVADIASDATKREALYDGMVAGSQSSQWAKVIASLKASGESAIVRTADNKVTITLPAVSGYDISANQTITVTIPPGLIAGVADSVTPTPVSFTISAAAVPVSATLSGTVISTVYTESAIQAGGKTIVITVANSTFATNIASDSTKRNNLFNSFTAGSETSEWSKVISALVSSGASAISRDNDTQVTITLPPVADYNITTNQTITLNITQSGIISGVSSLTAIPTFTILTE